MAVLDIIHYGNPVLRKKAEEIIKIDESVLKLAKDMIDTLPAAGGIGLAAPQVNVSRAMIVYNLSTDNIHLDSIVLINPEIISKSAGESDYEEGCLSVPGVHYSISRPCTVTVKALNVKGEPVIIENADGILARVLQHEIDHLNGKFFTDYIPEQEKEEILSVLQQIEKESRKSLKK